MTTTIHLSGPADVLTVLPYQLGFHPHECLVVVSLRGTRMGLVQRIDLPPPEHVVDAVAAMIAPLRQDTPRAALLIGFEQREGQSRAMLDEMADACLAHGIEVADRMVVRGGRWFDLDCTQGCCPPEGLPLPPPSEVPAVAEFVGREICPLPDRSALADLLEPNLPQLSSPLAEVLRLADEWSQLRQEVTDAVEAGLTTAKTERGTGESERGTGESELGTRETEIHTRGTELHGFRASELAVWSLVLCDLDDAEPIRELPPQDLAMLAVSLTDVDLRDGLIAWLCPGALPQDLIEPDLFVQLSRTLPEPPWFGGDAGEMAQVIGRQRIERRLCELCAALPDALAVPVLTVLASFTWWRGDGALTRIALDRALRTEPHYRLAELLERMVDLAIRPERASA
ncbi:MAG TPA: DUF4192 domain-containing protein [Dermatophilaceae bacterium]|nr:DUF4192 domain-containing protein [Dermatophilaceae bacterium]